MISTRSHALLKVAAVVMLAVSLAAVPEILSPEPAVAAAKKKAPAKKKSAAKKVPFDVNKYIDAHRANNRAGVHEQLVAANSNWRRTFTMNGTSGINLLMLACQAAAETESMDAIYTLMDNCPDLINAKDSKGQTAIIYALTNSYTLPFETLLNDKRTNVTVVTNYGLAPIQMVTMWGAKFGYQGAEAAIWEMINRGASLVMGTKDFPSAIEIMDSNNAVHLVQTFLPVAQQQLAAAQGRR